MCRLLAMWLAVAAPAAADPLEDAARLQDEAADLYEAGRYPEAAERARLVLALRREALGEEHPKVATALHGLGLTLKAMGDYPGAKLLYEDALAIQRVALGPDHPAVAHSLEGYANLVADMGNYEAARSLHEQSLAIRRAALGDDHPEVASGMNNLGSLLESMGEYEAAVALHEEAIAIWREALGPEHPHVAAGLNNLANAHESLGEYTVARPLYEEAIAIRRKVHGPDHPRVGTGLHNLAILLSALGDHQGARLLFEQSMAIWVAALGPDHPDVSLSLNSQASLMYELGQYQESRALFERSLEIREKSLGRDHPLVADALSNLGILLDALGDAEGTRRLHEESLAIKERTLGTDHPSVAGSLNNLASLLHAEGDIEGSLALFRQILAGRREALPPDHPDVAESVHNLASALATDNRFEEARVLYEETLEVRERTLGPDHLRVADALNNLAVLMKQTGELSGARAGYERSLDIRRSVLGPNHLDVASSLGNLAVLVERQGEMGRARDHRDEALRIVEVRLALLESLSEREALVWVRRLRPKLDAWLARYDEADAGWVHALKFKGAVGAGLRATRVTAAADPEGAALSERLATTREALARLTLSREPGPDRRAQIDALTAESESLQRELMATSAPYRTDRAAAAATPADLCSALPDGSALVDVLRYERDGEAHYTAFTLHSAECAPARIELGPAAFIDDAIADWRSVLSDPIAVSSRVDTRGARVTELLWEPIAAAVGGVDHVLLVPDGPIAAVPFAALPTGSGYLVERVGVTFLDRANDLLVAPMGSPTGALVVGDVDYDLPAATEANSRRRGALAACRESAFNSLPATRVEADALARRWRRANRSDPVQLDGSAATEAAVSAALAGKAVGHIATHGFFATGRCKSALHGKGFDPMLLSGLVLAGANRPPDPFAVEDGVLTAAEVASLDLAGTRLVVLSACETGLGEVSSGEGVLGLRRAFAIAGVHTLVMSLWSVEDEATAALMDSFYRYHLRKRRPLDPTAALRRAQLDQLVAQRQRGELRPQAWAGFIASRSAW